MSHSKAFTLIELLVVIAIIALLSSVVMASLDAARKKGRDSARIANLREVEKALAQYYSDNGGYPSTSASWWGSNPSCYNGSHGDGTIPGLVPTYIAKIPLEMIADGGTGNCYLYRSDGVDYKFLAHRTMESCSVGACLLQDPARMSQVSSSVYTEGARLW